MEFDNSVAATWNGAEIARSDDTVIDGDHYYFPEESVNREYLVESDETSRCWWKGTAVHYDVVVDGQRNPGAAFRYPRPKKRAAMLAGRIAFGRGVEVS
jgi:uncharacterized protein (DUF427 family)